MCAPAPTVLPGALDSEARRPPSRARGADVQVKARLVTAPPEFLFKVIDKDGVRIVEL